MVQWIQDLAKAANLDNDHFIRTTDTAHKKAVQYFWVSVIKSINWHEETGLINCAGHAQPPGLHLYRETRRLVLCQR